MNKYIEYVNKFQEGNEYGLYFIENQYKKEIENKTILQNDVEHILDYLYSEKKIFKFIGYKTILEKANKWNSKLIANASDKDCEIEGVDYVVEKDFKDGFKFVKLISKECYAREGRLMSHCVASYFGRDVSIYSLRDVKNLPHATIEENNQVKGKGNQTVDNKYFSYCIKFLEEKGFSIGENEMKNIGYYKLDSIDENLSCEKLWNDEYVSDKDLNLIKDKKGNQYLGFGLLNIKPLFELNSEMKPIFNFNIDDIKNYFITSLSQLVGGNDSKLVGGFNSKLVGGDRNQLVGGDRSQLVGGFNSKLVGGDKSQLVGGDISQLVGGFNSKLVGGDRSQLVGGNYSKLVGGFNSKLVGGDRSQLVGGNDSKLVGGFNSKLVGGDRNQLVGGNDSKLVGGNYSKLVGGNKSQLAGGDRSQLVGGDYSKLVGGIYSQLAGGYESKLTLTGKNSIAIGGSGSVGKGVIGSYVVLSENDSNGNIETVEVLKIDGKKYKENTFYKLEKGVFIEAN